MRPRKLFGSERVLSIYGITKIGKSQVASRLIELEYSGNNYFWFTFTNVPSDRERMVREIATWVGKHSGIWQLLDDAMLLNVEDSRFWQRVDSAIQKPVIFVFDEFHKGDNSAILKAFKSTIGPNSSIRLLILNESKATSIEMLGVRQIAVPGFNPKETMLFVSEQGIDPRGALIEIAAMSFQFGGHPLMLKAICQLLPTRPTGDQVRKATENLPSASSVSAFLADLSNKVFFNLVQTTEQRKVLSRLAILTSHFDKRIAFALATVKPPVTFSSVDWTLLSSTILDAAGPDGYVVPPVLKHIAQDALPPDVQRTDLLVAAAKTFLTPKAPTQPLDFVDFQSAIFAFLAAQKFQTAAYVFSNAIPTLLRIADYDYLQVLFLVFNAPTMQQTLKDSMLRWRLLMGETVFLIKDGAAATEHRAIDLLKQMRSIAALQKQGEWFFRITLLTMAASIRGLRMKVESPPPNAPMRLMAPIFTALRIAIRHDASEQIASLAKFVSSIMRWAPFADILVLDALSPLLQHIVSAGFAPNRLADLYLRVVFSPAKGGSHHRATLLRHAAQL
jgi:hypothetical protein